MTSSSLKKKSKSFPNFKQIVKWIFHNGGFLNIDGVTYNKFGEKINKDNERIQDVISSLITMMTDNAKERLADKALKKGVITVHLTF